MGADARSLVRKGQPQSRLRGKAIFATMKKSNKPRWSIETERKRILRDVIVFGVSLLEQLQGLSLIITKLSIWQFLRASSGC